LRLIRLNDGSFRAFAVIPRYYFSVENGHRVKAGDGEELAYDEAACAKAQLVARDLAKNKRGIRSLRVVVRGADDKVVCEAQLAMTKRKAALLSR
jgi:hypothetical protein